MNGYFAYTYIRVIPLRWLTMHQRGGTYEKGKRAEREREVLDHTLKNVGYPQGGRFVVLSRDRVRSLLSISTRDMGESFPSHFEKRRERGLPSPFGIVLGSKTQFIVGNRVGPDRDAGTDGNILSSRGFRKSADLRISRKLLAEEWIWILGHATIRVHEFRTSRNVSRSSSILRQYGLA